jgi:hypothetical protein
MASLSESSGCWFEHLTLHIIFEFLARNPDCTFDKTVQKCYYDAERIQTSNLKARERVSSHYTKDRGTFGLIRITFFILV